MKSGIFIVLLLCWHGVSASLGEQVHSQRDAYQQALDALDRGRYTTFVRIKDSLETYPLYRYLEYADYRHTIRKRTASDIDSFFERYPDSHLSGYLRKLWLHQLARTREWRQYVQYYDHRSDKALRCLYVRAQIQLNKHPTQAALDLWRVGYSQPKECDPVFAWLKKNNELGSERVWERTQLALRAGRMKLASYLSRQLNAKDKAKYQKWRTLHRHPERIVRVAYQKDSPFHRQLAEYAVKAQLNTDLKKADALWKKVSQRYGFESAATNRIERLIALRAAQRHQPEALTYLQNLSPEAVDDTIQAWRIRAALREQNWGAVARYIQALPEAVAEEPQWQYWKARSAERRGQNDEASAIYQQLSKTRSYYGFMASERLGTGYTFHPRYLNSNDQHITDLQSMLSLQRMRELLFHDQKNYARLEWNRMLPKLSEAGIRAAARLMHDWGWHEKTIKAVAHLGHYDDVTLRFPQPYKGVRDEYAKKENIDPNWVYAIMRRESAMTPDASSPANAKGLMQLLPSTARSIARKKQWAWKGTRSLFEPERNIRYGAAYLGELYERWQDSTIVLATASYNAGPHRVSKWLPKEESLPVDIWIDTIPFEETRKYVRIVSEYRSVIDWINQGKPEGYGNQLMYAQKTITGNLVAQNSNRP